MSSDNSNSCFNRFFTHFFRIYNNSFPIKKKKIKSNSINLPWITPELRRCIKKKYRLYNLYRRGLISKRDFNTFKNMLTWVKNKMRKLYFKRKFLEDDDIKTTWANINKLLNRSKVKDSINITSEAGAVLNGARLANHINNYFISLPTILVADLPNIIDFNYFNYLPRTLSSFYFLPTNFNEVYDLIMNLKNKGSSLSDVKPDLLKLVINKVSPFIVKCYNLCIQNGSYPDDLKNARVIPVFKSGSKDKVQNYRPISNLSVFNKIFEKLTYSRISCFF